LAHAVETGRAQHCRYYRIGNVVRANKDRAEIKCGRRGRVVHVVAEVSVDILLDGDDQVTQVPNKDLIHLDLQVVTHEIQLIDNQGQKTGKFVACMVLKDHEDGFYDILCQDGREAQFLHTTYLRMLSPGMFTDVGYLSARSARSTFSATQSITGSKVARVCDSDDPPLNLTASGGLELPPAGYIGFGSSGSFAAGSALAAARSSGDAWHRAVKKQEDIRKDDVWKPDLPAIEPGSCVCPFMEIQDGGLRAFMAVSNFTVNDTVLDIGCGHGKILNKILECCPCRGIGVEVNYSVGRHAEHALRKYGDRAKVVINDIRNVDLQDVTVTVSFLLSHSFDANGGAIKEHLSKNLRPGSVVLNYTYAVPGWSGTVINGVHKYIIGEHLAGQ